MRALLVTLGVLLASPAYAWDGSGQWWAPADAANPGSGGIFGTGGAHDYNITCKDCHVDRDELADFDLLLAFSPPLTPMGTAFAYVPGQQYQVSVTMQGEDLAVGGAGCDQYMMHTNNFAASFQDASGAPAGTLASDSGQTSGSCPTDWPYWPMGSPVPPGTTGLVRDCQVIFSRMDGDVSQHRTSWQFSWTAPAAGGAVTLHYGAVDGNCMMNSMEDSVKADKLELVAASAATAPDRRSPVRSPVLVAMVLLLTLGLRRRRR